MINENPSPFLDGANKLEDIIEYSSDKRKVSFGLCDFDVFLQEYAIDKTVEIVTMEECKFSDLAFLAELKNLKELDAALNRHEKILIPLLASWGYIGPQDERSAQKCGYPVLKQTDAIALLDKFWQG